MTTIKQLEKQLEKVHKEFQSKFDVFKSEILSVIEPDSDVDRSETILHKFKLFEKSMTEVVNDLKSAIKNLSSSQEKLERRVDNFEYQSNRNAIIIHGLKQDESDGNCLYDKCMQIFKDNLDIPVTKNDINFAYRMGKQKKADKNMRPKAVIVRLVSRWMKDRLYGQKKKLKGSGLFISEWLPPSTLNLLKSVKAVHGTSCWIQNGKIMVRENDTIREIASSSDIKID